MNHPILNTQHRCAVAESTKDIIWIFFAVPVPAEPASPCRLVHLYTTRFVHGRGFSFVLPGYLEFGFQWDGMNGRGDPAFLACCSFAIPPRWRYLSPYRFMRIPAAPVINLADEHRCRRGRSLWVLDSLCIPEWMTEESTREERGRRGHWTASPGQQAFRIETLNNQNLPLLYLTVPKVSFPVLVSCLLLTLLAPRPLWINGHGPTCPVPRCERAITRPAIQSHRHAVDFCKLTSLAHWHQKTPKIKPRQSSR